MHKKDGTIRYALIFNNQTIFDSMPDATDRCSKLASRRSFTKIDNFIDDIVVYKDILELQMEILEQLFQRVHKAGLKGKQSKCLSGFNIIDCLGHMIASEQFNQYKES